MTLASEIFGLQKAAPVIASAAKQSKGHGCRMDCFGPWPRNDDARRIGQTLCGPV
jgi:hypothetical protein